MRFLPDVILGPITDAVSQTGIKVDASQLINMSFHVICSDTDAAGTVKIQVSNDYPTVASMRTQFVPTNWVDLPNATVTLTAGGQKLIVVSNLSAGYIRAVFTQTTPGTGTITVNLAAMGA